MVRRYKTQSRCSSAAVVKQELACRDDRLAWVSALAAQKLCGSSKATAGATAEHSVPLSKALLAANGAASPVAAAAKLVEDLKKKDGMADTSCQRLLVALQKQIRDTQAMMREKDKQIQHLMDERRQLQTELVTESQRLDRLVRALKHNTARAL
jgi:polyhydroxyalkanoate synthesis regulator phasin